LDIYILNIETATVNCSVSISKNGVLLNYTNINTGAYSHAEKLHPLITTLLEDSNLKFNDLSAIAVGKGPGSFTGLRIGISAAKGLCYALGIPLISIDTLYVLSQNVKIDNGFIIPLLDARRMEVYTAIYTACYKQVTPIKAIVLTEESFTEYLTKSQVYFVGDGVEKFKTICTHKNAYFDKNIWPLAKNMVQISYNKFKKSDTEDVAYFEPFYLKDFRITKSKK